MYQAGGKKLQETLWNEMMKEFEFAHVTEILGEEA